MKNDKNACVKRGHRKCFFTAYHSLAMNLNHPRLLHIAKEDIDSQQGNNTVENFILDGSFTNDYMSQDILNGDMMKGMMMIMQDWNVLERSSIVNWRIEMLQNKAMSLA